MFRNYIEHQERALHGRDNNRRSLPFEWGLEHVGLASSAAPLALEEYARRSLDDSESFFACPPTSQYDLTGGVLRFPSAVTTAYPENNTVWGRFFDGGKDLAVVVLPQWNSPWDGQVNLCRMLQRAGISSLRLSMPYHHSRKPAQIERAEYLVSPNIGRTISAARQSVLDARRAADWLIERGHRRIGLIGTSIGSCVAFLTFAHDERFSSAVFIHVAAYFADVVWHGLSTKHVRFSLEPAIGLNKLRELWMPISPFPFVKRIAGTSRKILALSGRFDLTFLPELSKQLYDEFEKWSVPCDVHWQRCGHYTLGKFPFNVVAGYQIVRFLTANRR